MRLMCISVAAAMTMAASAQAGSLDWANEDQITVVGQIGSAMANATPCNLEVDTDGLARVIRARIAGTGKLTPEMASSLVFSTVGLGAASIQLLGVDRMSKRELASHCSKILSYFGPKGTALSGLLKP